MSTFNGLLAEFPDIRVDYFRSHSSLDPPLACFLSHIHSDHLAGLESFRSPFVYCSAATREMLLRLERYPCRINYANGILEARIQRYRHLKNLLKPLPLETPTSVELSPGNHIQVTLFDANHCPGAVMFLFEGQGKAVLYTGDIRSEPWFVNAITRCPSLIEYSSGLKTLDMIYLDTSFIDNIEFPTKSEGIAELLRKVFRYPADTVFHFQAWTYGYEDVWIALSKALRSRIHVDEYKMLMFRSLVTKDSGKKFAPQLHLAEEAPALVGFMCGNTYHPGCLTLDEKVRLHSCEKGSYCQTVQKSPVVWIRPIITRLPNGQDVAEVGVGGGGDDLEREAELDYLSPADIDSVLELLGDMHNTTDNLREQIRQFLLGAVTSGRKVPLDLARSAFGENNETDLVNGLEAIIKGFKMRKQQPSATESRNLTLPNTITFPYSRHSSYPELCNLVQAFKPRDVWPCTVDVPRWLFEGITIEHLFSQQCSGNTFRHDELMREQFGTRQNRVASDIDSQVTVASAATTTHRLLVPEEPLSAPCSQSYPILGGFTEPPVDSQIRDSGDCGPEDGSAGFVEVDPARLRDSQGSAISDLALETRMNAFEAVLANAQGKANFEIGLLSTTDNHSKLDEELTFTRHIS